MVFNTMSTMTKARLALLATLMTLAVAVDPALAHCEFNVCLEP